VASNIAILATSTVWPEHTKDLEQLPRLPTKLDVLVVRPIAVEGGEIPKSAVY